ncbi:MAG TPA: hypothetical protein IAB02_02010 [Candidatus Pullichristensenella excrementigallinarum]|uniref:Uncharacterized protein n=1 Tax=Candidatus Pullichristensenella excrementigallinarum TaxID=2840907 RepID=A0A9D1IAX8_9FIRM|nr:hypothetical protein [Candidatus Pullichristensenella excrementigallinarum]
MVKLVKYEFRKKRAALLVILGIILALEAYFLGSLIAEKDEHIVAAFVLIAISVLGVAISVFALGVSSYSQELRQKSSYLVFMTPNSTLGIVASKYLFTFFLGLLFAVLMGILTGLNYSLLHDYFGTLDGLYFTFDLLLTQSGLPEIGAILLRALFFFLSFFLELLSIVGVAYLSITLSATLLQNKRGKGLVSFLLFALISYGLNRLYRVWQSNEIDVVTMAQTIRALLPAILQNGIVLVLTMLGCAWMLDRRLSL